MRKPLSEFCLLRELLFKLLRMPRLKFESKSELCRHYKGFLLISTHCVAGSEIENHGVL